ncbi:MAG TPA: cytochrome c [Burkholderiaceae bacterium]|nr:cytochrome c [Burkholderiaceae bacterium]HQR70557.1 cytochrome c [Burkholderiaceae bacterium]
MWRGCATVLVVVAGAVAVPSVAQEKAVAKADAARGQQVASQVCATCHAADGNSTISGNPKLAQQHAHYLVKQLGDYTVRSGAQKPARENAIMNGIAPSLSEQDRRDVAAWFSSQAAKPGTARNKDTLELGQRIWRAGLPQKSLPACSGCHNPAGAGIPDQYPRLAGQHSEYTEATLKAFRDGTRRNNVPMQQIAARLSDAEIAAVADYIQGLRR